MIDVIRIMLAMALLILAVPTFFVVGPGPGLILLILAGVYAWFNELTRTD